MTNHGRPRLAVLSIDEYVRLKRAADESVPTAMRPRPVFQRNPEPDPLSCEVADLEACALAMADDALGDDKASARATEIEAVERRFGYRT